MCHSNFMFIISVVLGKAHRFHKNMMKIVCKTSCDHKIWVFVQDSLENLVACFQKLPVIRL